MNGSNDDESSTAGGSGRRGRSGSVSQGEPTILLPGSIYNGQVLGATLNAGYIKLGPGPEEKLAIATGSGRSIMDVATIECWVRLDGQPDDGEPRELISIAQDSQIGPSLTIAVAGDHRSIVVGDDHIDYPFGPEFHHLVFLLRSGIAYSFSREIGRFEPVFAEDGVGASLDRLVFGGKGSRALDCSIQGLRLWDIELTPEQITASARQSNGVGGHPTPETLPELELTEPHWPLLAYSRRSALVYEVPSGPWISQREVGAVADQAEIEGLEAEQHGYYERSRYLSFTYDPETHRRLAIDSDGAVWRLVVDDNHEVAVYELADDAGGVVAQFTCVDASQQLRYSDVEQRTTMFWVPVAPSVGTVAQAWNDVFVNKAPNLRYNLLGWDVRTMDLPPNIHETGVSQFVFQEPDGGSHTFHTERLGQSDNFALPHGLQHAPRATSSMQTRTVFASNSAEHAISNVWGFEVSLKDNFVLGPYKANVAVKHNQQHHTRSSKLRTSESSEASTKVTSAKYALVLDRANMPLTRLFTDTVRKIVGGEDPRSLFEVFGTHYAHAVTYGGRASRSLTLTKSGLKTAIERGEDLSVEVSVGGGVGVGEGSSAQGVSAQFEAKGNLSRDTTHNREHSSGIEKEEIKGFGSVSAVGGIHEGGANEMPVFVDHRPITELLAPPYFDDPRIAIDLRRRLEKLLEDELTGTEIQWGSYFVEFRGVRPWTLKEWQDRVGSVIPFLIVGQPEVDPVPWRGHDTWIGWPEIRYDKSRPLPSMSRETGWLRLIVPSDLRELSWHYDKAKAKALPTALPGRVALEPPGIVKSPTEIFRDDLISIHLVPSNDVLAGAWAVPPPSTG